MNKLNVAIADDNERVIQSLSEVIEKDENMHLIGKSTNGKDFYELIKQKQPDVVLVDLIMPKLDGLMVIHKVNQDETIGLYDHYQPDQKCHGTRQTPRCTKTFFR